MFTLAIIGLWIAFGLVVAVGNLLYRFSDLPFSSLLGTSLALYPLFILVSLLSWGFWGMGFLAAAAVVARFIARDGRRLAAFGCILAACFIVAGLAVLV